MNKSKLRTIVYVDGFIFYYGQVLAMGMAGKLRNIDIINNHQNTAVTP